MFGLGIGRLPKPGLSSALYPGVKPDPVPGVKPVLKLPGSKVSSLVAAFSVDEPHVWLPLLSELFWLLFWLFCAGPASMAGLNGPDRRDCPASQGNWVGSAAAGLVKDDRGGSALCLMLVASPPLGGVVRSWDWDPRENDCSNGLGSRSKRDEVSPGPFGDLAVVRRRE